MTDVTLDAIEREVEIYMHDANVDREAASNGVRQWEAEIRDLPEAQRNKILDDSE